MTNCTAVCCTSDNVHQSTMTCTNATFFALMVTGKIQLFLLLSCGDWVRAWHGVGPGCHEPQLFQEREAGIQTWAPCPLCWANTWTDTCGHQAALEATLQMHWKTAVLDLEGLWELYADFPKNWVRILELCLKSCLLLDVEFLFQHKQDLQSEAPILSMKERKSDECCMTNCSRTSEKV